MTWTLRLTLLAAVVTAACAGCVSNDWKRFRGMCYWHSNYTLKWDDAKDVCHYQFPGSDMVSIHDLDLNAFIAQNLLDYTETWLGLSRDSSSSWEWSDGSSFDFNNWYGGDPVYFGAGCATTNWNGLGDWTGHGCSTYQHFMCQLATL